MKIEVITQSGIGNIHWRCVGDVLNAVTARIDCQRFRFAVAYMRVSGLKLLYDTMNALCARNGHISGAVGIDQGITTREALELLQQFSSDSTIVGTVSNYIYHPKLYLMEGEQWACAVVGSSNLTRDGLYRNVELATLIHLDLASGADIDAYISFDGLLRELLNTANPNVQPLNAATLKQLSEMAFVSDEVRMLEPRSIIRRREVPAIFKALFPPLPVRPVVSDSTISGETPAVAFGQFPHQPFRERSCTVADNRPEEGLSAPAEVGNADILPRVEHHHLPVELKGGIRRRFYKTSRTVCNSLKKCAAIDEKINENFIGRIYFLCKACNKSYFSGMNDSEKISLIEKANTISKKFKFPLATSINVVLGRDTISTARETVRADRRRENEQGKKRARNQRWRPVYGRTHL